MDAYNPPVPDTTDLNIANNAIAWEITRLSLRRKIDIDEESRAVEITNLFIKV
jgi:hypothetical protein